MTGLQASHLGGKGITDLETVCNQSRARAECACQSIHGCGVVSAAGSGFGAVLGGGNECVAQPLHIAASSSSSAAVLLDLRLSGTVDLLVALRCCALMQPVCLGLGCAVLRNGRVQAAQAPGLHGSSGNGHGQQGGECA